MDRPKITEAPGLAWRQRANGWIATWVARQDIVKKGFRPATQRLMLLTEAPTDSEIVYLRSECQRLQDEMLAYGKVGGSFEFESTLKGLSEAFQLDPDSEFHTIRFTTRQNYIKSLKVIVRDCGARALHALGARDFRKFYDGWRWPQGKDGPDRPYTAHGHITTLRRLISFGIAFEYDQSQCLRLHAILSRMEFQTGDPRTQELTADHCEAVRSEACRVGVPSVALAQALQFELSLRQKDVIGQWVPVSEPGISDLVRRGEKWLYGLRWEEIDSDMVLRHQMTKSRKKKILEFDLRLYPMVTEELAKIPDDKRSGPLVICEATGQPWKAGGFKDRWRRVAKAAGVPDDIRNMDSRAGATTETLEATEDNVEAARKQAGHANAQTTHRYSRGLLKSNSKVAILRAAKRTKNEA